jgi:hypothetical protein
MRAVPLVAVVVAIVVAGASAAPFTGKPPMVGSMDVSPTAVATDFTGARYVAGLYTDNADLDPGPGVQTRRTRGVGSDPYVTKFDADGKWVWSQTFGGTANDQITGLAVNGTTVFACGRFESNDAGFGAVGTISAGYDANNFGAGFVLALDIATGAPVTGFNGTGAQTFRATGGGRGEASCVHAFGSTLYVGGSFSAFDFGLGATGTLDSSGQLDGWIARLDGLTGAPQIGFSGDGFQTFGGNGHEVVTSIATGNSRVYVGGTMSSVNFGVGGPGSVSSGGQYDEDAFLVCLQASNGNALASFAGDGILTFGATGTAEHGAFVATDLTRVYLVGDANGANGRIDGAGSAFPVIGGSDAFVLSADALTGVPNAGFAGGLRFFGSSANETTTGLVATTTGVYVSGYLGGAGAGIGAPGNVEDADTFLLGLDPATGGALAGFAGDGVATLTGGFAGPNYQAAFTVGMANGSGGLALLGVVAGGGRVGPEGSKVVFPAPGPFLVLFDPATGDPINMSGVNHRPVFAGPPIPTPNPVVAGKPSKWKVLVSDPDKNKLKLFWSFGDETNSTSKAPSKTYANPGTYTVEVTADDGKGGQSASIGTDIVVVPAGTPYFDVTKLAVVLKFPQAAKDNVGLSGQFPLADGTALAGKTLTIDVGGVQQSFVLAATGKGATAAGAATVKAPKAGVAKFAVNVHGDFAAALAGEGLTADKTTNKYAPVVVTVTFDGVANTETYPLFWTNKSGKSGSAK